MISQLLLVGGGRGGGVFFLEGCIPIDVMAIVSPDGRSSKMS